MSFVSKNINTVSSRLLSLYASKGIDTNKKGWYLPVADSMKKAGLLDFSDDAKRAYTGHVIEGHLKRPPKTGLSFEWIDRYCRYFKCSADYIMGYIETPTHEQKTVTELTGVSKTSAAVLLDKTNHVSDVVDNLLLYFNSKSTDLQTIRAKNLQRSFWENLYSYINGSSFVYDTFLNPLFEYWNNHTLDDALEDFFELSPSEKESWKKSLLNIPHTSLTEYEYKDRNFNAVFQSFKDFCLMGVFRSLISLNAINETTGIDH